MSSILALVVNLLPTGIALAGPGMRPPRRVSPASPSSRRRPLVGREGERRFRRAKLWLDHGTALPVLRALSLPQPRVLQRL